MGRKPGIPQYFRMLNEINNYHLWFTFGQYEIAQGVFFFLLRFVEEVRYFVARGWLIIYSRTDVTNYETFWQLLLKMHRKLIRRKAIFENTLNGGLFRSVCMVVVNFLWVHVAHPVHSSALGRL